MLFEFLRDLFFTSGIQIGVGEPPADFLSPRHVMPPRCRRSD
jgi:hypothetical protein